MFARLKSLYSSDGLGRFLLAAIVDYPRDSLCINKLKCTKWCSTNILIYIIMLKWLFGRKIVAGNKLEQEVPNDPARAAQHAVAESNVKLKKKRQKGTDDDPSMEAESDHDEVRVKRKRAKKRRRVS